MDDRLAPTSDGSRPHLVVDLRSLTQRVERPSSERVPPTTWPLLLRRRLPGASGIEPLSDSPTVHALGVSTLRRRDDRSAPDRSAADFGSGQGQRGGDLMNLVVLCVDHEGEVVLGELLGEF